MVDGLSWQEARAVCPDHADRLVGARWPELACPLCDVFTVGPFEFKDQDVGLVLAEAWRRQRIGRRPFSRSFWLGRAPFYSSRLRYDLLLSWFCDLGLVIDRRDRASGRLVVPPKTALAHIRRWFGANGRSGASGQSGQGRGLK